MVAESVQTRLVYELGVECRVADSHVTHNLLIITTDRNISLGIYDLETLTDCNEVVIGDVERSNDPEIDLIPV